MTSGVFRTCPIDNITINRDARQRRILENIEELADSISRLGLIHPPVITRDYVLVAGERRLAALKRLGWDTVPFQFQDDIDEVTLAEVEFEENVKRQDIPWLDRVNSVEKIHAIRQSRDPSWTQEKTAVAVGYDRGYVVNMLQVAEALKDPEIAPRIIGEKQFSKVRTTVMTETARRNKAEEESFKYGRVDYPHDHTILCARFEEWALDYNGPPFNFIHCDFPYGIGFNNMGAQAGSAFDRYSDDPDDYQKLLQVFCTTLDQFAANDCHFMFWFSMNNYQNTYDILTERAQIKLDPFPLIWLKSDNTGIIPDHLRGPRRIYETAFFGRRGDPRILTPKANACTHPSDGQIHPHEKPEGMLNHFFEMIVDKYSTVFDPTCGSGSALRAARSLGAKRIFGLEADERFALLANHELEKPIV